MSSPQEMEWDMFPSCQGEDVCDTCSAATTCQAHLSGGWE